MANAREIPMRPRRQDLHASLSKRKIEAQRPYYRVADALAPDVWFEPCQASGRAISSHLAWGLPTQLIRLAAYSSLCASGVGGDGR